MAAIRIKRVYDQYSGDDGYRVFVEKLWPRGIKKEDLKMDLWAKDLAPSDDLRRWYSHDPEKWDEFRKRYRKELCSKKQLEDLRKVENLTLLVASKSELNGAAVIKEILEGWDDFEDFCSSVRGDQIMNRSHIDD
ncbi:conserved hypothetical protein [Thermoplasma acidophilum]|uniref:DUF488 family protein n=1 Tax=Thermoplasma acidophilum (strain ATCC 25905 / DSM 1728 / JCM 9062 / NBRC 15155 / AMRC-C165) TaxID=273075 RepID=Q9HKD5_THEAC|nr:DUF488 domain-containing protein [Thermoplasma acidophilum]CAC11804.1 conserved hypothetical protein [Thermoplasma acidophilum]